MFLNRRTLKRLTDEARNAGLKRGYQLGYMMGQIEKSNRLVGQIMIAEMEEATRDLRNRASLLNDSKAQREAQQIIDESGF